MSQGTGNKSPKVLHVVISMAVGGAERLVYDMVRYPAFADNRPVVCCMDAVGELGEKLRREGYRVHCKGRKPGIDLEMIRWLKDRIVEERADVVHAHQYSPLFYATPAAFLAGRVKVVYTEHGRFHPERKSWKRALVNPLLATGVDHLVSISKSTAQAMARFDRFPATRIKVVHNGVDLSRLNPPVDLGCKRRELGIEEDARVVGTAARLDTVKNIPMMLRAFKLLLDSFPKAQLVIAGEGPELAVLQSLAQELGIAGRVRFLGLRFDLPEIYRLFEVFLLTSFSEGISVTLLEAMASGVPAVVTDVGGNGDVVVEGATGFLVPVDAVELYAGRIRAVLEDADTARRLGDAGRHRVERLFSFSAMADAYRRCYLQ